MTMKNHEMNRIILRLAIPNVISNIAIPLLGMIDTAIAGHIGDDANIAALAIGTTIFNFIYWNCAFLRMGTSGITAQAYGAGKHTECANMLVRALWVGCIMAALLLLFQRPVGLLSLAVMQGSERVQTLAAEYFFARIWAVPASIQLFALHGWFIGMQDAKTPMWVSILSNIVNTVFSVLFVFHFDMGIAGIAWGTVVAQYTALVVSYVMLFLKYPAILRHADFRAALQLQPMIHFLHINKDIFLRTACVVAAYTFFTAASARFGDTILTTNALLMQLFTLFSYMSDGFAYAGESLAGRYVGEHNEQTFRQCVRYLIGWSLGIAVVFVGVYIVGWEMILQLFSPSGEIIACARDYIGWIIAVPLVGCVPFMIDGIMIGATQTKLLRNTVFVATMLYFVSFYALLPWFGNTALWIAFLVFLSSRGILLYFCSGRLDVRRIM